MALTVPGLISPGLLALAQPAHTPHEDPYLATGRLDEAGLLLSYSLIIDEASRRRYRGTQDILEELEHASLPDDIQYITDRYSNLYRRLFTTLDSLESWLDDISRLLTGNRADEARVMLDAADGDIRQAVSLMKDVRTATTTLEERFSVFAAAAPARLTHAHRRLEESLARLADLIDQLSDLRDSLTGQYIKMSALAPTELSLGVDPAAAFVGDSVTASGRLSDGDAGLDGRSIVLYLAYKATTPGNTTVTATTNTTTVTASDGIYRAAVTLPYAYTGNMTLTARYGPAGGDADVYLASLSQSVTIEARFYPTRLRVDTPASVYAGLPFDVSGQVDAADDSQGRVTGIFLDGSRVAEAPAPGPFRREITPPGNLPPGRHTLTVAVPPMGRYSGARQDRGINVLVLPVHIDVQTPTLVILPGAIRIGGRAYHDFGPVADTPVILTFKDSVRTVVTSPDGYFNDTLKLDLLPGGAPLAANPFYTAAARNPFDLSPVGVRDIAVTMTSPVTAGALVKVKRQVITANPLTGALALGALAVPAVFFYRRRPRTVAEKSAMTASGPEQPVVNRVPASRPGLSTVSQRVIAAYRRALEVVERITGAIMAPSHTLREFLETASLPTAITRTFAELTAIAESALYSASGAGREEAARAEELADTIREERHRGTA
ncbi:MAG TPA: DUF4129 domain-containing protein [Dehalococcoidales bacterium]|nr:DUF4129 domain-containing protein [Dehalococcoidales bacterium]